MTGTKDGTNQLVLRKFYVAAVRSLIDYAAPVLTTLTNRQAMKLEVAQNNALRHILGAPIWAKMHNLCMETGCPTLATRISSRLCGIASCFATTLRETLTHPPDGTQRTPLLR